MTVIFRAIGRCGWQDARRKVVCSSLSIGFTVTLSPISVSAGTTCFSHSDKPIVSVIQQAPPPVHDGAPNYAFYPATAVVTMKIDRIASSTATMPMYFLQWANHGPRRVPKSNIGAGIVLGSGTFELFSSIDHADACTMAQTATVLGDEAGAAAFAEGKVSLRKEVSTGNFTDVCFLEKKSLASNAGILLDYEPADRRSPA